MERINRELVQKGIEQNIISFDMEDDMLIACIGDYWFFISDELDKGKESFSKEELVNMVYESINDEPINDEDEEQATECLYYKAVLLEQVTL
jgi:hypothetical protein